MPYYRDIVARERPASGCDKSGFVQLVGDLFKRHQSLPFGFAAQTLDLADDIRSDLSIVKGSKSATPTATLFTLSARVKH
jgi:hypothetical protein